jgi:diaminopimelate decarboxylase
VDLPPHAGGRPALPAEALPAAVRRRLVRAAATGRPVSAYLYDPAVAAATARAVKHALPPWAEVFYAVKANRHPAILAALAGAVDGFDVASKLEVDAVAAAAGPRRLLATGPAKHLALLRELVGAGAELVNVESALELDRLDGVAAAAGRSVRALVRVNPRRAAPQGALVLGGEPTAFGVDEADLGAVLAAARTAAHVDVVGFHLHVACNVLDAGAYAAYVRWALDWAASTATRHGVDLRVVDVGGGLGVDFADGDHLDLHRLASELARVHPPAGCRVIFEPGRLLVAEAGWYAAEVVDVKRVHGEWFAVLRGGIAHFLLPCSWDLLHPFAVVPVDRWPEAAAGRARPEVRDAAVTVVGELCTSEDTLARHWRVERIRVGDVVVFPRAGAYGREFAIAGFLGHPEPETWTIGTSLSEFRATEIVMYSS